MPVPLGEVAEQLTLVVGDESVLDPSVFPDLAHRVPGPREIPRLGEIRGLGPSETKKRRDNRSSSPRLKASTNSIASSAIWRVLHPSGKEASSLVTITFASDT